MMLRPSRDALLMETARVWAKRGTCSRAQVGVVLSRNARILVEGYNGTPAGMTHCFHACDCGYPGNGGLLFEKKHFSSCTSLVPCLKAVHAEANAIAFAARDGINLFDSVMHTTRVPCYNCSMLIINAGIKTVYWAEPHRDMTGRDLLREAGIQIVHLEPEMI